MEMFKIKRTCMFCRREYESLVIDGHVTYPNICDDCTKKLLAEKSVKEEDNG